MSFIFTGFSYVHSKLQTVFPVKDYLTPSHSSSICVVGPLTLRDPTNNPTPRKFSSFRIYRLASSQDVVRLYGCH